MAVTKPGGPIGSIDGICLTVPALDRAVAFYRDVLHFSLLADAAPCAPDRAALLGVTEGTLSAQTLRLGRQTIELLAFDPPGEAYPPDSTASDLWFQHCAIVVGDMALAVAALDGAGIRPITRGGPQTLPPNTGGVTAFKFRDPFGHPLELLVLPPGVGNPAWQAAGLATFEGIDHTAIAVGDADRSAGFYEAVLGFERAAGSTNAGPGQSRLDDIPDVTVDILPLTPRQAPPHLELLGYRTGRRRPRPADWTPRHQAIARTLVSVDDVGGVIARLATFHAGWAFRRGTWDGEAAVALEDPDGHALIIHGKT